MTTTAPGLPNGQCLLDDLGVLEVAGADAARFLQGQLSQDVSKLDARARFAGLHSPQGRTLAILRLVAVTPEVIRCVLPRELVGATIEVLRKYVLRSKVTLADASDAWHIVGVNTDLRMLRFVPRATAVDATIARDDWRAADIADGLPQVYGANREAFVAQMLNLDCVGGIAFDKGCYTGQEVIARAHYRGRVKRRMQRFRTRAACDPASLAIGAEGALADGRGFRVVERVAHADGRIEFLAVAPLAPADRPAAGDTIDCEALPLPYALPA